MKQNPSKYGMGAEIIALGISHRSLCRSRGLNLLHHIIEVSHTEAVHGLFSILLYLSSVYDRSRCS